MKRSKSSRILKILSYVLLITGMIVILYPFYLTIITALKTPQESSQSFFSFPQSFYLGNFVNVLQKANYFVFFRNSAVVTFVLSDESDDDPQPTAIVVTIAIHKSTLTTFAFIITIPPL